MAAGPDSIHPNPDVARRLEHLYSLHRKEMDLRLGADTPYGMLLARLGNPHHKQPPVIHVAGTNGKGSTIAFMRACLEAAGYRVHVYTSPHLLRFNERIRLAGKLITDEQLIDLYDRVIAKNDELEVTFFEFTSAMTFLAFTETPADIVLLETGMGGRLDCSNVVEQPAVTVITKISYDHVQFLGTTLPAIAYEKAGIIKHGVPCVIGPQMDMEAVLPVFKAKADEMGAPLILAQMDDSTTPNLVGAHQLENAATALAALGQLKTLTIPPDAITYGLTHTEWPGRMQRITEGPVAALLPPGWELWFDGAHNDSGAMALADQLKTWKRENPARPIHLLVGMGANKDAEVFFKAVTGTYDTMTLIDLPVAQKPQTAKSLQDNAHGYAANAAIAKTAAAAIKPLIDDKPAAIICVAGSLYLYQTLFPTEQCLD